MTEKLISTKHFEQIPRFDPSFIIPNSPDWARYTVLDIQPIKHLNMYRDRIVAFTTDTWHIGKFLSKKDEENLDAWLSYEKDEDDAIDPPTPLETSREILFKDVHTLATPFDGTGGKIVDKFPFLKNVPDPGLNLGDDTTFSCFEILDITHLFLAKEQFTFQESMYLVNELFEHVKIT